LIAFASNRNGVPNIYVIKLDGTGLEQLTTFEDGACQPDWSPDGKKLVFVSPCGYDSGYYPNANLWLMNADGNDQRPLMTTGGNFDPAWSPDERYIAFTSLRRQDQVPQIFILDLENPDKPPIWLFDPKKSPDTPNTPNTQPAWSPDSKEIAFTRASNSVYIMGADGTNPHLAAMAIGEGIQNSQPDWSPDGTLLVLTQNKIRFAGSTWLATAQIGLNLNPVNPIKPQANMSQARFSPDGIWLVYQTWPNSTQENIYIMLAATGSERQPITTDTYIDFDPAWQP
jgi:Tol biopolymer transport system component